MKIISSAVVRFAGLALAIAIVPALAQSAHVLVPADKVVWGPAPPVLPAGAQISVLEGNPQFLEHPGHAVGARPQVAVEGQHVQFLGASPA